MDRLFPNSNIEMGVSAVCVCNSTAWCPARPVILLPARLIPVGSSELKSAIAASSVPTLTNSLYLIPFLCCIQRDQNAVLSN